MEFFRIINRQVSEINLQNSITPKKLENFTESMFYLSGNERVFQGGTIWGEFSISYNKINGGVRFTLLDCPNALAWTITTGFPPERTKIVLHCTINRTQKAQEFIEEIEEFLSDWENGLLTVF